MMRGALTIGLAFLALATAAPAMAQEEDHGDEPAEVRIGALINDIQQLDLQSHSYNVDMYIWFKWDDPKINPARSFEFLNAFELWGHIITFEEKEVLPDGSYYQVIRNQGKFNTKLPLERYPFDTQELKIEIEDANQDSRDFVYVPDTETEPVEISKDLTIPGWHVGQPELEIVDNKYATNFGDPSANNLTFSRAIFELPVTRPKGTYAVKLLLPMILVALTAILALLIHPRWVEGRLAIGITALLTLVALQLTSNSSLPEVDYLILLDKLYILSYVFVVATIGMVVRNSWVDAEGDVATAKAADRRAIALLTVLYFAVASVLFITSLA